MIETTSFASQGFLDHSPGREFMIMGHGVENASGLLAIKIVLERDTSDMVIDLGRKQGLRFDVTFDDEQPDLAMLETIGLLASIERVGQELVGLGYHRLPDR